MTDSRYGPAPAGQGGSGVPVPSPTTTATNTSLQEKTLAPTTRRSLSGNTSSHTDPGTGGYRRTDVRVVSQACVVNALDVQ